MRAGQLREWVTIESPTDTTDGQGGVSRTWALLARTPAAIDPLSSLERLTAGAVEGRATATVRIRYRAGVTADCRIVMGSRVFAILGPPIDVQGRHRELQLICSEKA